MHRHVEVVASRLERSLEDRRVEPRIAGVHDDIGVGGQRQFDDVQALRGIDAGTADPVAISRRRGSSRS